MTTLGKLSAIVVPIVLAALYVENIRSHVQVVETRISSMEKAQDVAESGLRRELQRLEAAVERRISELISVLREGSRKATEPAGAPGKKAN